MAEGVLEPLVTYRVIYDFGEDFPDKDFWSLNVELSQLDQELSESTRRTGAFLDKKHEAGRDINEVALIIQGVRGVLEKQAAVEQATVYIMGWLNDQESNITFTRARLWITDLLNDQNMVVHEDVTVEARLTEARLKLLHNVDTSDFE